MNNLRPSDLAKALDIARASITMAVKGGTLVWDENKNIDLSNPINKAWLFKMKDRGKTLDFNRIYATPPGKRGRPRKDGSPPSEEKIKKPKPVQTHKKPVEKPIKESDDDFIFELDDFNTDKPKKEKETKKEYKPAVPPELKEMTKKDDLFIVKQKLEIKKLENQDKKDKLQIAKLEGELLPVDAVENIFLWATSDMAKTYEQDANNMITKLVKMVDGTKEDFIMLKKQAMEDIAMTGMTYKENLMTGIENQIKEYKSVRSRGERK
ncbi:MAG: hypothetical protein PF486_06050 [Prolixibacteraceae bacterium]|jgi:hypothetical protein|nr:hypothetical protein [Prolixibacteraceae bacterium]